MPLTTEQKINMIYQAVVGVPENPCDNGLIGECREMKEQLRKLNGSVAKNTTARKIGVWAAGILSVGLISLIVGLLTGSVSICI